MATKFIVNGKAQVAQASHEREKRKTNVGSAWNEVLIGFIGRPVPVGNDNAEMVAETVSFASYIDWFTFGGINNVLTIPGQAGTNFVGICSAPAGAVSTIVNSGGVDYVQDGSNAFSYVSMQGTTILTESAGTAKRFAMPLYNADGRSGSYLLKLTVQNPGAANQTITVASASTGTAQTPTAANAKDTLRTLLTSATYLNAHALTWNAAGAALPLPDTWFLRAPFLNNRIRWCVKGGLIIS